MPATVKRTSSGQRNTFVTFFNPGTRVKNSDGGYDTPRVALDPPGAWAALVEAPMRKDMEKPEATTTLAVNTYFVTFPFHPHVTTQTTIEWEDNLGKVRTANFTAVTNPDQLCIENVCVAVEIVP